MSALLHLQPTEHVCQVATSKVARPTYSWDASLRIITAQLHRILCNTIKRRDSDSSWRWEGLMLSLIWIWNFGQYFFGSNQFDGCSYVGGRWTVLRPPIQQRPLSRYIFWRSVECHCLYQMGTGSPKQPFLLDRAVCPTPRYAVTLRCGKISWADN